MTSMQTITAEGRRRMIAEAAWHRAEARGFANGDPMLDWLEAEREIDALLNDGRKSWLGKLEDRLATARGEIRCVKSEVESRAKSAKVRLKQDIEKMDELLDRFEDHIGKLRERGEKATQKARVQAEKIWDEIQELRQRVVGKQS